MKKVLPIDGGSQNKVNYKSSRLRVESRAAIFVFFCEITKAAAQLCGSFFYKPSS